jgi:four helix bundle protein
LAWNGTVRCEMMTMVETPYVCCAVGPVIRRYNDLTVWQRAVELFVAVTKVVRQLPLTERLVFEVQIRRAARSVVSNISEGHERHDLGDYLRHLSFSRSSLAEVETDLVLIEKTNKVCEADLAGASSKADEVGRMLTTVSAKLRRIWESRKRKRKL